MSKEWWYIQKRMWMARFQSILFYLCRLFPVEKKKIVFCCIEGTTGYSCNPKYIAEELIRENKIRQERQQEAYVFVWLVNDIAKPFPKEIKVVHNNLWNRSYQLSTARVWIDNSRKQLEVRKRKGQIYIQTWHAKLGFKPTCLDRGKSFSRIAYLVSKHDSDLIDYVLSNSKWYEDTLPTGMIYNGPTLRTGSPRCDVLVKAKENVQFKEKIKSKLRKQFGIKAADKSADLHFAMYAPTFRGGSQGTNRELAANQGIPDYKSLTTALEQRFGGVWYLLLRLHPQLVVRNVAVEVTDSTIFDISKEDDMYELLAGCDAFVTDYSSAAFDAAVMRIPVFLYADDYENYEGERGKLLWDMRKLPFPLALNNKELKEQISTFDEGLYLESVEKLFKETEVKENGNAAKNVTVFLSNILS